MPSSKLQPALYGGLLLGVLSALPIISLGNCACCLWVLAGGAMAAYLLLLTLTAGTLVAHTWLASSFESAAAAALLTDVPVVTLAGDVCRSGYLVSGGGREESRGILSTKREIKELREKSGNPDSLTGFPVGHGAYLKTWWRDACVSAGEGAFIRLMCALSLAHAGLVREAILAIVPEEADATIRKGRIAEFVFGIIPPDEEPHGPRTVLEGPHPIENIELHIVGSHGDHAF